MNRKFSLIAVVSILALLSSASGVIAQGPGPQSESGAAAALGTAFTYQGQLKGSGGSPLTATCNFKFSLWDGGLFHFGHQIGAESTLMGVSVVNGYFTVAVNSGGEFGASAFNGEERWLQVAVQCGTDPGYTNLIPRQQLTPAPYAKYAPAAGSAPWSGLTGVPAGFADNVDNDTTYTAGNGLTLTGTVFSLNFAGSGSANAAARSDHNHWGGSWSGMGAGLSLNSSNNIGLSASGPLYGVYGQSNSSSGAGGFFYNISSGVGVHAESASGSPLEAYVGGSRKFYVDGSGNAYASGGTPLLPRALAPTANSLTTLDSAGDVGYYTSITIGADGLGLISYHDATNGDLKVLHCGNAACNSGNTMTTVDSAGDVGGYTSITIGVDGLPMVSYYDATNGDLKVLHCGNVACSSGNTVTTVDSTGDVGYYTSITIGADGLPKVSYYDATNGDLKMLRCGNATCNSGDSYSTLDSADNVGQFTSLTIGADGLGLISYHDWYNADLKVLHCGNVNCNSFNIVTTVDSAGTTGRHTSITLGSDGLGLISYFDGTTDGDLKVLHCGNAACSGGNTVTTVDSAGAVGPFSSITIGADGLGLISYNDVTNGDLKVLHCGNAACSSGNTPITVDGAGAVGLYTSITIGADGRGLISYYDSTNDDLKVLHCTNAFCVPYLRRR